VTSIFTKVSTGTNHRDIGNGNEQAMARQLGLTQKQFRDFVKCTLSEADYVAILRRAGTIT
jgi:hypothetical protein